MNLLTCQGYHYLNETDCVHIACTAEENILLIIWIGACDNETRR